MRLAAWTYVGKSETWNLISIVVPANYPGALGAILNILVPLLSHCFHKKDWDIFYLISTGDTYY